MDFNKVETLRSYNKHYKEYAKRFRGLFDLKRRKEFKKFILELKGNRVLDVGCGEGSHSEYFKQRGLKVNAIDLSERMAGLAKSKGVEAIVMDMEHLGFSDNSFDGIWAVISLLHIEKVKAPSVIRRFSDILDENGLLFLCLKEGCSEGLKVDYNDNTTRRYFAYYLKEEVIDMTSPYFNLIRFRKKHPQNTTYLHFLFRKKGKN